MDKSLDEIIGDSKPTTGSISQASKGVNKRRNRRPASNKNTSAPKPQKTVCIQNLSGNISEDDLRDLFRQVGPVVRVEIQRESNGNRTGVAWIVYDFAPDALAASERFNKRQAAGKVITVRRVARVGDTGSGTASLNDRIGPKSGNSRSSRRKASSKEGSKPKASSKSRNASDLDAELDAYMQVDGSVPFPSSNEAVATASSAPSEIPKPEESMIDV